MSHSVHKWLLVRKRNGEVRGIMEVKNTSDDHDAHKVWATGQVDRMTAHVGSRDWNWQPITQSVYETYRDLHGFTVIEL